MRGVRGIEDLGVFRVLGQPNLNVTVDRRQAARYQINVADVQDAIQTAVGGNALTQVLQGEARYDLVMRYLPQYRNTKEAIENIRLLSPTGERVSLAQLCTIEERDGASEVYREANQRYIAVKYSVRDRDLGSAVEEAMRKVTKGVQLPRGYRINWEGEYESAQRARARLFIIVPLTVLLIFIILYTMFRSFKWAMLILVNVMAAPIGGLLALLATHTNFSVSSGVGFLALFGVSVQTGVIMLEYINQRRARGASIEDSAIEGAVLRLRPIMMTMLVATLGLLPAALSHDIGSDSQRPFAIVIVGGLMAALAISIFLLPTLYVWLARTATCCRRWNGKSGSGIPVAHAPVRAASRPPPLLDAGPRTACRHECRHGTQECAMPLSFPQLGILHNLWGGPPGPRGSPWTRPLLNETSRFRVRQEADEGVGRGPGGPPHNPCRTSISQKLSGIAQKCVRHLGRAGPYTAPAPPTSRLLLPVARYGLREASTRARKSGW